MIKSTIYFDRILQNLYELFGVRTSRLPSQTSPSIENSAFTNSSENRVETYPVELYTSTGEDMEENRNPCETRPDNKRKRKKKSQVRRAKVQKSKIKITRRSYLLLRCPICLDNLHVKAAVSTKCGHVFCRKCIQRALAMQPLCPACRKKISHLSGFHELYLDSNFAIPEETTNPAEDASINISINTEPLL